VTKIRSPDDFDRLPKSKETHTGSIGLGPWAYGASDASWHQFSYQWHTSNWMRTKQVKVRRELITMPFERPTDGYYKTISMKPVLRDGRIVGFTCR
jgi:hypothetical protein